MLRLLDFIAGLCLVFDVDWTAEYEDDAWVKAHRAAPAARREIQPVLLPAPDKAV